MGLIKPRVYKEIPETCLLIGVGVDVHEAWLPLVAHDTWARCILSHPGMEALVVAPVSKASAKQRAGRAGRMRAGVRHSQRRAAKIATCDIWAMFLSLFLIICCPWEAPRPPTCDGIFRTCIPYSAFT